MVQNGNAYDEGLDNDFWKPLKAYWQEKTAERETPLRAFFTREATIWQYTNGVRDKEAISPDNWNIDQPLLDRPGNAEIQLALFYSYGSNPPLYPKWQAYFRQHQPPMLIVWGKNDEIFPPAGAEPYKRDLKNLEFHLLDTGHFALEEDGDKIADLMRSFPPQERQTIDPSMLAFQDELAKLKENLPVKILIVLTSHDQLGDTGEKTGFWLEEFAAPYYVLKDAGAAIILASPQGGQPPLDPKSDLPENQTELTKRFRPRLSCPS